MKGEKQKNFLLGVLLVGIVSMTIAYAALSTTLRINSAATVKGGTWDIHFANGSVNGTPTTAPASGRTVYFNGTPSLATTTISNVHVVLTQPGDSATYTFDIVNDGTIDAKLSTITAMTPTCTGTGATSSADETKVCTNNGISRTLTYKTAPTYDSGKTYSGNQITAGNAVAEGDVIPAGQTATVNLTISYAAGETTANFPANDVSVSYPEQSLVYVQD